MRIRTNLGMPEHIVVYVGGWVHSLNPLDGKTIWETKLPKAYQSSIGSVVIDGDVILAGVGGRVYCLDVQDGRLIWTNEMPGLGLGMVSLATPNTSASSASEQQNANAQAAATSAALG